MSGHSKWANIKNQKAATDAKRGKSFSKLISLITAAAKGGPDLESNPKLRMFVDKAKAANMPQDNIERAIKRGSGTGGEGIEMDETIYEAYGPGGSAVLIKTITDNKNRALGSVKQLLNKHNAKLASPGSVLYLFKEKGYAVIDGNAWNDSLEMKAIEAGADDFKKEDDSVTVYATPDKLNSLIAILKSETPIIEHSIAYVANDHIDMESQDDYNAFLSFIEDFEDNDDVAEVFHNVL
jgi:YebC/PmpR family DNA-binding regulatory protein